MNAIISTRGVPRFSDRQRSDTHECYNQHERGSPLEIHLLLAICTRKEEWVGSIMTYHFHKIPYKKV
eukprot:scaffold203215_cov36-Prasinocladus_malaysianus.AAC.1